MQEDGKSVVVNQGLSMVAVEFGDPAEMFDKSPEENIAEVMEAVSDSHEITEKSEDGGLATFGVVYETSDGEIGGAIFILGQIEGVGYALGYLSTDEDIFESLTENISDSYKIDPYVDDN
jgi:coenzyme F420-reducing hydrogenase beta subunit